MRSVKYVIVDGPASAGAGTEVVSVALGVDNATLGQTGPTDGSIPTGARIESMDIFMPKVNLGAATANFITWTLQRTVQSQAVINPLAVAGSGLRKNVILTGVLGLGAGQNNQLHIKFKIPRKFQRMSDGDAWSIVNDNGLAVSVFYYIIYKVIM